MSKRIELSRGKFTLVDDEDYNQISQWKWHYRQGYTSRTIYKAGKYTKLDMHRLIMDAQRGEQVDHISGDTLDNRRCNLRICTLQQNQFNRKSHSGASSRYKGVHWHSLVGKWAAKITEHQKTEWLGLFSSEEMAARAYDDAAKRIFGEFARLNFP